MLDINIRNSAFSNRDKICLDRKSSLIDSRLLRLLKLPFELLDLPLCLVNLKTICKLASMLQSGLDIEPIITHRFDAEEYEPAFELMFSGQSGKILLDLTN